MRDNLAIVKDLTNKGANIFAKHHYNETALHYAAKWGKLDKV